MGGRGALAALAGVSAAAVATPAVAQAQPSATHLAEGAIVVNWRGDPARCEAAGLCGVTGSLVYSPEQAEVSERAGIVVLGSGADTIARVVRQEPGLEPGTCIDLVDFDTLGMLGPRLVRLELRRARYVPVSGRCAGPTGEEMRAALPVGRVGERMIDFRGTRTFAAGPLTGEVASTLVLRRAGGERARAVAVTTQPRPRRRRARRFAIYSLTYRIERVSGAVAVDFRGAGEPSCRLVDACGVTGTATHSLDLAGQELFVEGRRRLRRGERPGSLRAALGGRDLVLGGGADLGVGTARTLEEVFRPGGATCRDTLAGPAPRITLGRRGGGRLTAQIEGPSVEGAEGFADPVRTHCPGPASEDAFGSDALAAGSVPARALAGRRLRLVMWAAGGFASAGYAGARRGEVVVELRRTRARTRIERSPR